MIRFLGRNKLLSLFILVALVLAGYFFWLNRMPFTDNAFVVANIRPVAAEVPGPITHIYVKNNHPVKKGDAILTIYKKPYELAVEAAEYALKETLAEIKLLKQDIKKNEYVIEQRNAEYQYDHYIADIVKDLAAQKAEPEVHAKALAEKKKVAGAAIKVARAELEKSHHELKRAQARKERLKAELKSLQIKLEQTTLYAHSDGLICNMFLSKGVMVHEAMTLFAFVDTTRWWIQANFKETVLRHVKPGMKAMIEFSMYPDRTFHGTVGQIGWGVNRQIWAENGMPVVEKENEWFLLPQRFPVQILLNDLPPDLELHVGQSAYVHIDTGRWEFPPIR